MPQTPPSPPLCAGPPCKSTFPSDVQLVGLLGTGSCSQVFHGDWSGIDVAVKVLREPDRSSTWHSVVNEAHLLKCDLHLRCNCA